MNKIAFKPHPTRGSEIIKIFKSLGFRNPMNYDGIASDKYLNMAYVGGCDGAEDCIIIDNISYLERVGYKIYTLEEYFEELHNTLKQGICEKTPSPPTPSLDELAPILNKKLIKLEDACEWIKENFECYVGADVSPYYIYVDEFVEDFCKAMEEQYGYD